MSARSEGPSPAGRRQAGWYRGSPIRPRPCTGRGVGMDDIDRLEQEGRSALAQAATSEELELARVAVLGRSAPVTLALRGVATLEPSERGPRGRGAERRAQAARGRACRARRGALVGRARAAPARGRDRRHAARHAGSARRRTPALADAAGDRGRLHRARLPHRRGPGGRARVLQLHGAEHAGRSSGEGRVGHALGRARRRPAHPHLARPGADDGVAAAARVRDRARAGSTAATRSTRPTRRSSSRSRASPSTGA